MYNLPNNPSKWILLASLLQMGKLKLNEIIKQDQGHTDLGSWKNPGLPSPKTNAFCISGMLSLLRT